MKDDRDGILPANLQPAEEPDNRKDPYHTLVVAILAQAVDNYLNKAEGPRASKNRKEAENWLKSRAFEAFCADFLGYDEARIADIRQALGLDLKN
jgi:hypothetical protein